MGLDPGRMRTVCHSFLDSVPRIEGRHAGMGMRNSVTHGRDAVFSMKGLHAWKEAGTPTCSI